MYFCCRNGAGGSALERCGAGTGAGAAEGGAGLSSSPSSLQLFSFFFLFKEGRYFWCLITRLELRLSLQGCSRSSLFKRLPASTGAKQRCFPPFGAGGVRRAAGGPMSAGALRATWILVLEPSRLWEMSKQDLFLWGSTNPAPAPSLAGG